MYITMPSFEKARVLVVGDVMLDRYWHDCSPAELKQLTGLDAPETLFSVQELKKTSMTYF